jgi:DNA-binding transcriptional ArsR family regulator
MPQKRKIMNDNEMKKFKIRAEIVKAMAHPTRLFFMTELANGKQSVNALQEMVGCDVSTVSKHLTVLRKAGIVIDEKVGTQVFYSLKLPCIMNFMECVETLIKENAVEKLSYL